MMTLLSCLTEVGYFLMEGSFVNNKEKTLENLYKQQITLILDVTSYNLANPRWWLQEVDFITCSSFCVTNSVCSVLHLDRRRNNLHNFEDFNMFG